MVNLEVVRGATNSELGLLFFTLGDWLEPRYGVFPVATVLVPGDLACHSQVARNRIARCGATGLRAESARRHAHRGGRIPHGAPSPDSERSGFCGFFRPVDFQRAVRVSRREGGAWARPVMVARAAIAFHASSAAMGSTSSDREPLATGRSIKFRGGRSSWQSIAPLLFSYRYY